MVASGSPWFPGNHSCVGPGNHECRELFVAKAWEGIMVLKEVNMGTEESLRKGLFCKHAGSFKSCKPGWWREAGPAQREHLLTLGQKEGEAGWEQIAGHLPSVVLAQKEVLGWTPGTYPPALQAPVNDSQQEDGRWDRTLSQSVNSQLPGQWMNRMKPEARWAGAKEAPALGNGSSLPGHHSSFTPNSGTYLKVN